MGKDLMNGSELGRLCSVSRQSIAASTQAGKLYRDPITKKYDPTHPVNSAYIQAARTKTVQAEIMDDDSTDLIKYSPDEIPGSLQDLYRQKIQMDIDYKAAQKRKLDLQFEKDKGNLIPTQLAGIFIGYFSSGIQNNFLTIANKAARGDLRLKDRIDGLITKAIVKTIENASRELRKESEQIIKSMGVQNEN